MKRFSYLSRVCLSYIFLLSLLFDFRSLTANSDQLQKMSLQNFSPIGISEKDIEVIISNPEVDFAYLPGKIIETLLLIEPLISKKQYNESVVELYYYIHNDYNVAPEMAVRNTVEAGPSIIQGKKDGNNELFDRVIKEFNLYNEHLCSRNALVSVREEEASGAKYRVVDCNLACSCKNKCRGAPGATGATGATGPAGATGATGATGAFSGTVLDNNFTILHATDLTKQLNFNVEGSPSTLTTIATSSTVNRTITTPDIDGTALVSQTGTEIVYIGGPISSFPGSNAGIQYNTLVANRAQLRGNQFGNNAGVPGITSFKSRGLTLGSLASVLPGDVLFRATAIGVTGNNSLIPLAGLISIVVPPGGVSATSVATDFALELVSLTGATNSHREVFRITSEGIFHVRETVNSMAGVATTGAGGTVTVANTQITATSRITLTIQDGGTVPTGFVYVSGRTVGTDFTIASSTADIGVPVYYQIWEPITP